MTPSPAAAQPAAGFGGCHVMTRQPTGPVAFVLSGGASLGAIQVGMLRALYERGIRPDVIVGTSAGALNGAFIASRPQTPETADALADVWRPMRRSRVFPLNPVLGLLGFLGASDSLVPQSGLERIIERHIEHARLEELPIALHVVAVDVITAEELLLSEGCLRAALLASAAIPGILSPVPWGEHMLMDGGVANNTPISHAVALGAGRIYVLPAGHACALERAPRTALGMAVHAVSLLVQRRLVDDVERHRDDAQIIVLPPPCPLDVQPIDFGRADELIAQAAQDARRFLDSGGEERPSIAMRTHAHGTRPTRVLV